MGNAFPSDRKQKREALLNDVDKIAPVLQACGTTREERSALSPEAIIALRTMGVLKLCTQTGGSEARPVTEMMVLEQLAHHQLTSAWCTVAGATGILSLGTFLTEKLLTDGNARAAALCFFPAGGAVSERNGFRVRGRSRFDSGVRHAELGLGGTVARALVHKRYERQCEQWKTFRRGSRWRCAGDLCLCNRHSNRNSSDVRPLCRQHGTTPFRCPRPFVARPPHRWPSPGDERHRLTKITGTSHRSDGRSVVMTAV